MRSFLICVLICASLGVASGGVYVASRAAGLLQERQKECLELREKLRRSEAEVDLLRTLLKEERAKAPASKQTVGADGTLSRKAGNYLNVKCNNRPDYWLGQCGIDAHGHAVFKSPEWSLRSLLNRVWFQELFLEHLEAAL